MSVRVCLCGACVRECACVCVCACVVCVCVCVLHTSIYLTIACFCIDS